MCSLSDEEIRGACEHWNPRNATVPQIRQAFLKMQEVLKENSHFPPSNGLTYAKALFGPSAENARQIWWIQNCATCGAPDDILKGSEIHLFLATTTKSAIVNWLMNCK